MSAPPKKSRTDVTVNTEATMEVVSAGAATAAAGTTVEKKTPSSGPQTNDIFHGTNLNDMSSDQFITALAAEIEREEAYQTGKIHLHSDVTIEPDFSQFTRKLHEYAGRTAKQVTHNSRTRHVFKDTHPSILVWAVFGELDHFITSTDLNKRGGSAMLWVKRDIPAEFSSLIAAFAPLKSTRDLPGLYVDVEHWKRFKASKLYKSAMDRFATVPFTDVNTSYDYRRVIDCLGENQAYIGKVTENAQSVLGTAVFSNEEGTVQVVTSTDLSPASVIIAARLKFFKVEKVARSHFAPVFAMGHKNHGLAAHLVTTAISTPIEENHLDNVFGKLRRVGARPRL